MNDEGNTSVPATTLESVLNTMELSERAFRPPNFESENTALLALAQHMADSPNSVLQKLAEIAMEACGAGSAGISLVNNDGTEFYWPAVAGEWKSYIGGGTPRNFGPCGIVLDRHAVQLFTHPERYYPYLTPVSPAIEEALLTPFYVNGNAVGTVWVISHTDVRFDSEHVRLLENLSKFAAAAYPLRQSLAAQEEQSLSMLKMNEALVLSSVHQHELAETARTAEVLARESEERCRALVSVITDIPWTTDAGGRFVSHQPAWSAYTGQTWEDARNFGWINALHPDDRQLLQATWHQALRERAVYRAEGRIWHAETHRYHHMQTRAVPIIGENGSPTEWVGACTDTDEAKRAKHKLETLNDDLKSFVHAASHDLQEPLRMVMIFAELLSLEYQGRLDTKADRYIKQIAESAEGMKNLLQSLLAYWTAGEPGEHSPTTVRCDAVLEKALMHLEAATLQSGALVTHDSLPTVLGEESPLLQLFQNLVGNAMKYRATERIPRIHITSQRRENMWQISIQDNGIGIPGGQLDAIFTPFKRLHSRQYSGTGLGLSMCRKIVERYGGQIRAESTVGQGSTFHFTLPVG